MPFKVLMLILPLFAGAVTAQDKTVTLAHGGQDRTYLLHVPAGYSATAQTQVPLIVDFHGLTSTASAQAMISGFRSKSDKEGFIVAWPQGLGNSWNAGSCCGSAQTDNVDDVGFARAVVAHVKSTYRIDARRVYVTGLSNGGAMTHRLASDAADVFAAAAVFSGLLVAPVKPSRPIALISFHAYGDKVVAYEGGFMPSASKVIQTWSQADKCQADPVTTVISGTNKCETYASCQGGVEASLCSIEGSHVIYTNTANIDLTARAWAFLSRFSLPAVGNIAVRPAGEHSPRGGATDRGASGTEGWTGARAGKAWLGWDPKSGEGFQADGRKAGEAARMQ